MSWRQQWACSGSEFHYRHGAFLVPGGVWEPGVQQLCVSSKCRTSVIPASVMADRAGPTGETLPHTSCGMSACATPDSSPSALPCVLNAFAPLLPRRKLNLGNVLEPTSLIHEEAWPGLPRIVSASQFPLYHLHYIFINSFRHTHLCTLTL